MTNSFPVSRIAYSNESNNFKCNYQKEIHSDVPCINIILRSDCVMKSTQHNCLQKGTNPNENKISTINKNPSDLVRRKLMYSDIEIIPQAAPMTCKGITEASNVCNKVKCDNISHQQIEKSMDSHKELMEETYPVTKLEGTTKTRTDFLSNFEKVHKPTMEANLKPSLKQAGLTKNDVSTKILLTPTNQKSHKECSCVCSLTTSYSNKNLINDKKIESKQYYEKHRAPLNFDSTNYSTLNAGQKWKFIGIAEDLTSPGNVATKEFHHSTPKWTPQSTIARNSSGEHCAPCCTNINHDSTKYSTLNIGQTRKYDYSTRDVNSKDNTTVKFHHSTPKQVPKSTVSKSLSNKNIENCCTAVTCDSANYSSINFGQETKHVNTTVNVKSIATITDNFLKPHTKFSHNNVGQQPTNSTAMDTLEGILLGIKNLGDKSMAKHSVHDYQHKDVRCKNVDCNTVTDFNQYSVLSSECLRPECIKMLEEIKDCTKTLEEQLIMMNKNMKVKKSKDSYYGKQRRDIITQNPEKENVCVQEPSHDDVRHFKYVQGHQIKSKINLNPQKDKLPDKNIQRTNKKTTWTEESKCCGSEQGKSQIHKKQLYRSDDNSNSNMNQPKSFKKGQNAQDQYTSCAPCAFDDSYFRPIAASTFKDKSLLNNNECTCPFIEQTSVLSRRSSQSKRDRRTTLNELISYSSKREECKISSRNARKVEEFSYCPEKAIVMLLLTRDVNNTHLKSRYKKLGLTNFKPKCIIDSCITSDQRLVKCPLPKRKCQIPSVFRQFKSVQCKIGKHSELFENACNHSMKQSVSNCKMSDLLATVCTQSSNLHITTATSVSCVTFRDYSACCIKERAARSGTCALS
ncbi:PREDICTED: uncharacterized protein LOC107192623 [Dufourea novaeangliae]|uniref:uncharacterized protein LOC107192623 n=1 Tax=Dufourea novaeangliae TaxID=178035 RepID=UPI000767C3E7|nr:PREDICTED: uncharacterized protein LOC107192623 [Dufourea novaeangliae]